jgi:hypothetical protein
MNPRLASLATAIAASAWVVAPASAAHTPAAGLRAVGHWPNGYYIYDAHPGDLLHGVIEVANTGTAAGAIRLYPADSTTGQTSGAVYLTSATQPRATGMWITLSTASTQLAPGAKKKVSFDVRVPAGAAPGQYLGGIVAEPVQEQLSNRSKGKTNVQIKVRSLAIVAVEIDIPGRLRAGLSIGAIKPAGRAGVQQLLVRLTNTGNVMIKPAGTLIVRNASAGLVRRFHLELDTFLPHTTIDYPVTVGRGLPVGTYTTSIELGYTGGGASGTTSATPALTISPQQETQIYGQTTPTLVSPATTPTHAGKGSGLSPLLLAAIAAAAVLLLAGVYRLGRRGR